MLDQDLYLQFLALDSGEWVEDEEDQRGVTSSMIWQYTKHGGRFNEPLREGVYCQEVIQLVDELNDLPPIHGGCVYRGTSLMDFQKGLVGDVFSDKAFLSTSRCEEQARDFLVDTLLQIWPLDFPLSRGRDVSELSSLSREREVLFLPGTKFEMVNISNLDRGPKTFIELREMC